MSQDELVKAISGIAAKLKQHPEQITKHLAVLQRRFPDLTEAKLKDLVAQLSASDLDLKGALDVAKVFFSKSARLCRGELSGRPRHNQTFAHTDPKSG